MKKNVGTAPALYPHAACGDRGDERRKTHLDARRAHGDHRARPHIGQPCRAAFYQRLHQKGRKTFRQSRGRKHAARSGRSGRGERKQGGQIGAVCVERGEHGAPVIGKAPLSVECTVADIYETKGFESFICTIDGTYVDEKHLDAQGKINYDTLKPVLFEFPTYSYLKTGEMLGKCLSFHKGK